MRRATRSSNLLSLPVLLGPVLLAMGAFLATTFGLPAPEGRLPALDLAPAVAEDGDGDDGGEPGDDLGDKNVPFAEQVNRAIKQGVNWLLAKPDYFEDRKFKYAHFGRINSPTLYGGGKGPSYGHPAGATALAAYTLLKCGVSPKHPVIVKSFNWLRERHKITEKWDYFNGRGYTWRHTEAGSSYELTAMILALTAKYDAYKKTSRSKVALRRGKLKIRDKDDREWLIELVEELLERRGLPAESPSREEKLGWRYNVPDVKRSAKGKAGFTRSGNKKLAHGNQDLSSTQLAALALFSAQRFGIKVPTTVWTDIIEFTLKQQEETGPEHKRHMPGYVPGRYGKKEWVDHARGFMYIKGSPDKSEGKATGSMTACGIANLLIAREMMSKSKKARQKFVDSGQLKKVDTAIHDGLAWLDKNWSNFRNTRSRTGYHIYYLYCVERAMDILGKRLIGKRLWYPEGAKSILSRQKPKQVKVPQLKKGFKNEKGVFWNTDSTHDPKDVLDTCFSLLYLKRATKGLVPGGVITESGGAPADGR